MIKVIIKKKKKFGIKAQKLIRIKIYNNLLLYLDINT